eukprot:116530-Rhodomonas_salina.3
MRWGHMGRERIRVLSVWALTRAWAGADCEWFFKNKKDFPSLCTLSDAARECPVACGSRQQCVSTEPDPPMFVSWDRIRRIESVGSNGTICLAGALTPEKVTPAPTLACSSHAVLPCTARREVTEKQQGVVFVVGGTDEGWRRVGESRL